MLLHAQDMGPISQAILLEVDDVSIVAVASSSGLQICQIATQQQLLKWSLPAPAEARSESICRGIAMAQAQDDSCVLCLGDSEGSVHIFRLDTANQAELTCTVRHHNAAIAALASGPAPISRANSNVLASCDDSGTIQLCAVKSATDLEQRHSWEGRGIPCTAVAIQDNTLLAALYDGTIYLYDVVRSHCSKASSSDNMDLPKMAFQSLQIEDGEGHPATGTPLQFAAASQYWILSRAG